MPYTEERDVTFYHDRDTPKECATSRDDDACYFQEARDEGYAAADAITSMLDQLYDDAKPAKANEMAAIAKDLASLAERVRALQR